MVNELQSQNWDYLLDPAFQLVNTKGSPLTGGHLEVFYNGTRTPYYCASDFNGTLHPFKIPLDSLGSNVVLADPKFSYDIYVYNRFGVLQMSRYNVHPGSGSGSGTSGEGGDAAHWIGKSGATVSVPKTIPTTLPLPENPDYEGDFATILNNTITLAPGLYMVDCLVDFRQSSSDLTNKMGSIKFYTSDSSDPIEGQIFERNETGPDASGDSHQVQVSFVRHVAEVDDDDALRFEIGSSNDLTYAKIDRLSIVKLEAGGGGTAYTAGYGIDITGQVISTSGMMPESSAANFVNVDTYNTDIQNIYETIAETSAMIPSGVATEQWVTDYTSAFITSADLPDLSDYATHQWVEDQHYITSADIPDIPEDVVTSGELATVSGDIVAQIPSLDGYATEQWVVEQGYITSADLPQSVPLVAGEGISIVDTSASTIISIDSAYSPGVSEEWVEDYVSNATSAFITSADIPDVPEDLVTSGELATVSGDIMSQMPAPTSVAIEPSLSSGTKIAEFNINGTSGELFAPEGGGSSSSDVFIAEAFVTQYQDVLDAYDAGKTIFAHYDGSYGGVANATYVLGTRGYNSFNFTCIQADYTGGAHLETINVTPNGWGFISSLQYAVPTPIFSNPVGSVLTKVDANNNIAWTVPAGGSEVDIIPTLQTGTKIAEFNINGASGELYAPAGGGSSYTAGDNISIVNGEISVSGTAGLIAGDNISITAYGDNYIISSTGGGGDVPADVVTSGQLATVSARIESDIPSLAGYATQHWVDSRGYLDQVWTHNSLTGDGTAGDPLRVTSASNWTHAYDAIESSASYWNAAVEASTLPLSGYYLYDYNYGTGGANGAIIRADQFMVNYATRLTEMVPNYVRARDTENDIETYLEHDRITFRDGSGEVEANEYITASAIQKWNSTYDAIDTSASYWNDAAGMNEYPISAGPGMSIEDVDGVTVFSPDVPYLTEAVGADETVIYNGNLPNLNGNLTLTESWNNFKEIRVVGGKSTDNPQSHYYQTANLGSGRAVFFIDWAYNWMNMGYVKFQATSDPKVWTYAANTYIRFTHTDTTMGISQNDTTTLNSGCNFKIVGIGRISGGN